MIDKATKSDGADAVTRSDEYSDPVIQAYKSGLDLSLIRRNLRLTLDERFEQLMSLQRLADELRVAGKRASKND